MNEENREDFAQQANRDEQYHWRMFYFQMMIL